MELNDTVLIQLLGNRDEGAFEQVFKAHFKNLHAYACTIVQETAAAEEIVQNVFYKIWEKAAQLNISPPVAAYLYRAVNNESINYLKHQKVKSVHRAHTLYHMKNQSENATKKVLAGELEKRLRKALTELPEQCRIIFQLSRFEELRYREIAGRLGISVKTVENQMGKALKLLRVKLVDFLPLLLFSLFNL
ncbi:MAG: RNA polymerase sigma-70 factor [Bacteroidetes bacterium]|nr:RNA polymerase sigma-70 factor [Bacteroidota bacterium]